jgi:hypothetical protein
MALLRLLVHQRPNQLYNKKEIVIYNKKEKHKYVQLNIYSRL